MEVKTYFKITPENLFLNNGEGLFVVVNPHLFPMQKGEIVSWTSEKVKVKVGEKKVLTLGFEDVILCVYQWERQIEFQGSQDV